MSTLIVPQGAEERTVRRAAPNASLIAIRAGASAAQLPERLPDGPLVIMGLCGALRGMRVGARVIYRDVADRSGRYSFDAELIAALQAVLPDAALVHACTAGHVITRAGERAALAAAYAADVVDMEGTHVARALAGRGRPCAVVRVVSDEPGYDLPPIGAAFDPAGAIRPLHLALAFATHPGAAARFIRDVRTALTVLGGTARTIAQTPLG